MQFVALRHWGVPPIVAATVPVRTFTESEQEQWGQSARCLSLLILSSPDIILKIDYDAFSGEPLTKPVLGE